jgi:NADPH:quinone reductase-like Zn-dependent oxidoreductase
MNAVLLDAEDQLAVTVIDDPAPAAGQVAIRVAYAGIQWGDVLVRQGHFPVPRPFVPGFEAAGEIVAVGEGVPENRIGERVAALTQAGAFADVMAASPSPAPTDVALHRLAAGRLVRSDNEIPHPSELCGTDGHPVPRRCSGQLLQSGGGEQVPGVSGRRVCLDQVH